MAERKPTLIATTPRGTFTRKTFNLYQFVVLVHQDGAWECLRWSYDRRTAEQGARYFRGLGYREIEIYPVDDA